VLAIASAGVRATLYAKAPQETPASAPSAPAQSGGKRVA
jgi:hypothetical protein